MASEINFGYITGKTLLAFVYQSDGTERDFGTGNNGIAMTEVAGAALYDGLYLGDCATIAAGDLVIITESGVSVGQGQYKPQFDTSVLEALISPEYYLGFDGVDDYLSVPTNAALDLGTDPASFTMWIKRGAETGSLCKRGNSTVGGYSFYLQSNQLLVYFYGDIITGYWYANYDLSFLSSDIFSHLAIIKGASAILVYANAVLLTPISHTEAVVPDITITETLYISALNASAGFLRYFLDDFRLYKKELSLAEIQAIYSGGTGKKYDIADAGAAAFVLNLDEGYGTTVTDEISALTGTLNGGITWHKGGTKFDILTKTLLPYVDKPNATNIYDMTKI